MRGSTTQWGKPKTPPTHRHAEMLPIVTVEFVLSFFQSRVNNQLVTSPMVISFLDRSAGLRAVLHSVDPTWTRGGGKKGKKDRKNIRKNIKLKKKYSTKTSSLSGFFFLNEPPALHTQAGRKSTAKRALKWGNCQLGPPSTPARQEAEREEERRGGEGKKKKDPISLELCFLP